MNFHSWYNGANYSHLALKPRTYKCIIVNSDRTHYSGQMTFCISSRITHNTFVIVFRIIPQPGQEDLEMNQSCHPLQPVNVSLYSSYPVRRTYWIYHLREVIMTISNCCYKFQLTLYQHLRNYILFTELVKICPIQIIGKLATDG